MPPKTEMPVTDTGDYSEMPLEATVPEVPADETISGTPMVHTVDEIPGLKGLGVGDRASFVVVDVSEDGNTYTMEFETQEAPAENMVGSEELTQKF